tara:strand:- start:1861 stop:2868 length:1008 start_codon:yes stop_codon:yes gene_type:complete
MSSTQISDVIVPEVYETYTAENIPELTDFFESGVVIRNPMLDANAMEGGNQVNLPFWHDLDPTVEPNVSDDTTNSATPNKLGTGKQMARSAYLNQWYSNTDLAGELAGSDPNQQVMNRFGSYWTRQWQRRLIASCDGILADNVANDSSDMAINVAAESTGAQTAATKFNVDSFVDAIATAGDAGQMFNSMCVHSQVMAQLRKNDDIDFIPDSDGKLTIPTYQGLRLIEDDGMTVTAGSTSGFKYTTILFGSGAFGYGEGSPYMPVEVNREAKQGNGGGVNEIGERKTWLLHPFGFADVGTPASDSYTLAELRLAATWNRVTQSRKTIPLAYLITN